MSDGEMLLKAVAAEPDDEAATAALADWLHEHPDRIADVLRALARGGPGRLAYVSTSGSYSDYGISAVFLSKADAGAYQADWAKVGSAQNDLEVYPVGRPVGQQVALPFWALQVDLLTGATRPAPGCHGTTMADSPTRRSADAQPPVATLVDWLTNHPSPTRGRSAVVGSFVSAEHAEKLAAEYRQEFLRMIGGLDRLEAAPPRWRGDEVMRLVSRRPTTEPAR